MKHLDNIPTIAFYLALLGIMSALCGCEDNRVLQEARKARPSLELSQGWSWAGIAVTTLENQGKPKPTPDKTPGSVCPSCKGQGKVGDGRVFQKCRDCDGTGVVQPKREAAMEQKPLTYEEAYDLAWEQKKPLVVFVTQPACPPCEFMKREVIPKLDLSKVVFVQVDRSEDEATADKVLGPTRIVPTLVGYTIQFGQVPERLKAFRVVGKTSVARAQELIDLSIKGK